MTPARRSSRPWRWSRFVGLVAAVAFPRMQQGLLVLSQHQAVAVVTARVREARAEALRRDAAVAFVVGADGRSYQVTGETPVGTPTGVTLTAAPAGGIAFYGDGSSSGGEIRIHAGRRAMTVSVARAGRRRGDDDRMRAGRGRGGGDAGSVFVEAVIAAAIVAMALGGTFRVIADSAQRGRAAETRRTALLIAESRLAAVGRRDSAAGGGERGPDGPIWSGGFRWASSSSDGGDSTAGTLWHVAVSVRPREGGAALASLTTLRLGPTDR